MPQAVIVTGPNGKVKDCYHLAISLGSDAELNEKDAQDMMDAQERCSRNEAEEKIAAAYIETGGIYKDPQVAHDQARKDMQAIDDYAKAFGLSQGDRIELNMNIAVGLATGDLTLKEFQGMRDNAKEYTEGTKACNGAFTRFTKKCDDFQRKGFFNPGAFNLLQTSRNELSKKNRDLVKNARASSESHIAVAVQNRKNCYTESELIKKNGDAATSAAQSTALRLPPIYYFQGDTPPSEQIGFHLNITVGGNLNIAGSFGVSLGAGYQITEVREDGSSKNWAYLGYGLNVGVPKNPITDSFLNPGIQGTVPGDLLNWSPIREPAQTEIPVKRCKYYA